MVKGAAAHATDLESRRSARGPYAHRLPPLSGALALAFLLAAQAGAQQPMLTGRVLDGETGALLQGVEVTIRGAGRVVLTDERGLFRFGGLAAGTHWLEFRRLGYGERADSVTLTEDDVELEVEVRLSTRPVAMQPLRVTVRAGALDVWLASKGFPQRRAESRALLHTTHDEIGRTTVRSLNDLLRRVPEVRIRRFADGGGEIRLEPSPLPSGEPCPVSVYLNGYAVEFGRLNWSGGRWDLRASRPIRYDDLVPLADIDGIELYGPGESPVAAESVCGTLLLWSRVLRPQLDEPFTGRLHGAVVDDATGAVVAGVTVRLTPGLHEVVTDGRGLFAFPSLPPGEYRMEADYPDAAPWRGALTVKAFGTTEVELRLERGTHRPPDGAG